MMTDEIDVLMPDREVVIGDETVTVREYRFREGMEVAARAHAFMQDLGSLFLQESGAPVEHVELDALQDLFAQHAETVTWLIAKAIDKPPAWLDTISDEHGMSLMHTWWSVNQPFFTRRLVVAATTRRIKATAEADSGASLPH
jgi:hypothetical protein